jgi:tripartite-type tricarboxylate transporter receptor subunit TctC
MMALTACLFHGQSFAQEPFYTGKTIKVIVGFPPGGAYDVYARAVAKYLGRYIPGSPAVVVVNMPGAGSLVAANYMFNVAPKDGTEIASVETFIPFEAYYKGNGVRFNPRQFSWIAALNSEMTTCVVKTESKIKTFGDLLSYEVPFGATGSGAPPVTEPRVMNAVLGTKIKLVSGYPGTADIFLAMENHEVEGACGVGWTTLMSTRGDWVTQGKLRIVVQNAVRRHKEAREVPLLLDFAKTDEQRKLLTLLAAPHRIGRPYLAPPGLPIDRLQILRRALDETLKDPAFLAEAEKLKLGVNSVSGEEIEGVFSDIENMDGSLIEKMLAARGESGGAN